MFEEQLYIEQHLVVARAAGVKFLSGIANSIGEQFFYLGVNVFYVLLNSIFTDLYLFKNFLEALLNILCFFRGKNSYLFQHLCVSDGTDSIKLSETQVPFAVVAHSETLGGEGFIILLVAFFLPEFHVRGE